jgi:hypothetical protein
VAIYRKSAKQIRKIPNARKVSQTYGQNVTGNTFAVSNKLGNISKPYQFSRVFPFYLTVLNNILLLQKIGQLNAYFTFLDTLSEKFRSNKHLASCARETS